MRKLQSRLARQFALRGASADRFFLAQNCKMLLRAVESEEKAAVMSIIRGAQKRKTQKAHTRFDVHANATIISPLSNENIQKMHLPPPSYLQLITNREKENKSLCLFLHPRATPQKQKAQIFTQIENFQIFKINLRRGREYNVNFC
jgi:hypothetical protein